MLLCLVCWLHYACHSPTRKALSLDCRKQKDEHHVIATRILEKLSETLSAAKSNQETMSELTNYKEVLLHRDNLESVRECGPWCAEYNTGLCSALLLAASNGKRDAISLLATVFRCVFLPHQVVLQLCPQAAFGGIHLVLKLPQARLGVPFIN